MSPTIYLTILLGIGIGILIMKLTYNNVDSYDLLTHSTQGALIGLIIGVIIWVFIGIKNQPKPHQYEVSVRSLTALKNGNSISGDFFLGSGSFNGDMKYYGYESLGDYRYKMVKFPNSSIIVEDVKEGEKSYFIEIRKKADISQVIKYDKWMMGPFELDDFIRWEIHIPKGSILKGKYELDLE